MKRIVICSDGTWNRPERRGVEDYPTNVLQFARAITPRGQGGKKQVVFYDWGIGSYHDKFTGGGFGEGLEKNVMDAYRFLVHNYEPGDQIYLFGFSRGAYTVRSLCGLINNCSILRPENGALIEDAFQLYKTKKYNPRHEHSTEWRLSHSMEDITKVHFVGVWDTVGALGLPFSIFGLIKDRHLFYDRKLGSNIRYARHALSLDESRDDFKPTLWTPRKGVNLKQVWFAGVHSDVGGSYKPDDDGSVLADIPMRWIKQEAEAAKLVFDDSLDAREGNPLASQHNEYKGKYKLLGKLERTIPTQEELPTLVHPSVKLRYEQSDYQSKPIENYCKLHNAWPPVGE